MKESCSLRQRFFFTSIDYFVSQRGLHTVCVLDLGSPSVVDGALRGKREFSLGLGHSAIIRNEHVRGAGRLTCNYRVSAILQEFGSTPFQPGMDCDELTSVEEL